MKRCGFHCRPEPLGFIDSKISLPVMRWSVHMFHAAAELVPWDGVEDEHIDEARRVLGHALNRRKTRRVAAIAKEFVDGEALDGKYAAVIDARRS